MRPYQFKIMNAIQHPTSPKIEVEAPALNEFGLYYETQAENMLPPIPDIRKINPLATAPYETSR